MKHRTRMIIRFWSSTFWRITYKALASSSPNRLQEALRETDAKRSMVRALKENLNKTELTLMQSRERESQLEDQLNNAQREMKKISQELNQVAGRSRSNLFAY